MKAANHSKTKAVARRLMSISENRAASAHITARSAFYTATRAKNQFGPILDQAIQGKEVIITRHGAPRAVMISFERFTALKQAPAAKLNMLTQEFDRLFERMQTPRAHAAIDRLFRRTPRQLGQTAVAAVRKRG